MGTAFSCGKLTAARILEGAADKIFHNEGGLSGTGAAVKEDACFIWGSENIPCVTLFLIEGKSHKIPFFSVL